MTFIFLINGKVGQKQHPGSECGDVLSILPFLLFTEGRK